MNNKPFWQDKTCKEMAGLHVKATWKNGTIVTGVLDDTGDIDLGDNRSLYTSRGYDSSCDFEPIDNIQSIELLDDPEYERIDNIENVQVGDIACTTEGNHFRVIDLKPDPLGDMLLRIRISEIDGEYCIDSDDFAYALRRKPKLPDHDGLWWDKDNALRRQPMSDYKQRMIREHRELQERISKLAHMLEGYAEGTLDFTPACSFQLLESQLYAMGTYANILQERARIEQVDLNAPLEGGESGEVSQD